MHLVAPYVDVIVFKFPVQEVVGKAFEVPSYYEYDMLVANIILD